MDSSQRLPQWYYELTDRAAASGTGYSAKPLKVRKPNLLSTAAPTTRVASAAHDEELRVKRAWDIALSSLKGLPVNLLVSYFSGNSLQIVTISMVAYMFFLGPLRQIAAVQSTFQGLETDTNRQQILVAKLVYILGSLVMVGVGVWKVATMGLLPTHESDWLAWKPHIPRKERLDRL